tara:strand:+ start:112 stop:411 length:300 start_codon:yes stop_codon:yes gene_type:complete
MNKGIILALCFALFAAGVITTQVGSLLAIHEQSQAITGIAISACAAEVRTDERFQEHSYTNDAGPEVWQVIEDAMELYSEYLNKEQVSHVEQQCFRRLF